MLISLLFRGSRSTTNLVTIVLENKQKQQSRKICESIYLVRMIKTKKGETLGRV
jgi:hypothetical protein